MGIIIRTYQIWIAIALIMITLTMISTETESINWELIQIIIGLATGAIALTWTLLTYQWKQKELEREGIQKEILSTVKSIQAEMEENRADDIDHKRDYKEFKQATLKRLDKIEDKIFK